MAEAITGHAQAQVTDSQRKLGIITEDLAEMRRRLSQVHYAEGEEVNHWPDIRSGQESPMSTRVVDIYEGTEEGNRRYRLSNGYTVTSSELLPSCVRKVTSGGEQREDQELRQEYELLVGTIQQTGGEVTEWLTSETVRRLHDTTLAVSADRMSRALGQEPSGLQRES